jgi:hypothetical protein
LAPGSEQRIFKPRAQNFPLEANFTSGGQISPLGTILKWLLKLIAGTIGGWLSMLCGFSLVSLAELMFFLTWDRFYETSFRPKKIRTFYYP